MELVYQGLAMHINYMEALLYCRDYNTAPGNYDWNRTFVFQIFNLNPSISAFFMKVELDLEFGFQLCADVGVVWLLYFVD